MKTLNDTLKAVVRESIHNMGKGHDGITEVAAAVIAGIPESNTSPVIALEHFQALLGYAEVVLGETKTSILELVNTEDYKALRKLVKPSQRGDDCKAMGRIAIKNRVDNPRRTSHRHILAEVKAYMDRTFTEQYLTKDGKPVQRALYTVKIESTRKEGVHGNTREYSFTLSQKETKSPAASGNDGHSVGETASVQGETSKAADALAKLMGKDPAAMIKQIIDSEGLEFVYNICEEEQARKLANVA